MVEKDHQSRFDDQMNKEVHLHLETVFEAEMERLREASDAFKRMNPNFDSDLYIQRGFWQLCQRELPESWIDKLWELNREK